MPTYVIEHRIDTLLRLWEPFTFEGFTFSAWGSESGEGWQRGWHARKHVEANSVQEAFKDFSERFHQIIDRIAFIGQCHTSADLETFMISKPDDDRFFWRFTKNRESAPLAFQTDEIESLKALEKYTATGDTFRYLREATNATSFYTMLVMLVSALEAMAGYKIIKGKRVTDREKIANTILKDTELCDRLFQYGEGIRNQILHGGFVDQGLHGTTNYNRIVYDKIMKYFNGSYELKINTQAANVPRTVAGNYDVWQSWCQWLNKDNRLSLRFLHENFGGCQLLGEHIETIDEPDDF